MNTDLSDEALKTWLWNYSKVYAQPPDMATVWDACRLRAEAMIEERERAAFEAGWMAALNQHSGLLISHGVTDWSIQFHEAYRAWKEHNK